MLKAVALDLLRWIVGGVTLLGLLIVLTGAIVFLAIGIALLNNFGEMMLENSIVPFLK